jgi:protein TonB
MNIDKLLSFGLASLIHMSALVTGGALVKPAEFGVETGHGGLEVELVAAPLETESVSQEVLPAPAEEEEMVMPQEVIPTPTQSVKTPPVRGDGSSPVPGADPTTLFSKGGALTSAKPGYLKNPPPLYPEAARRQGQEGLVVLSVSVDKTGRPGKIEIKSASGFESLDASAVKAVSRWKFQPAKIGGMPIDSVVEVPIRFQLEEK